MEGFGFPFFFFFNYLSIFNQWIIITFYWHQQFPYCSPNKHLCACFTYLPSYLSNYKEAHPVKIRQNKNTVTLLL